MVANNCYREATSRGHPCTSTRTRLSPASVGAAWPLTRTPRNHAHTRAQRRPPQTYADWYTHSELRRSVLAEVARLQKPDPSLSAIAFKNKYAASLQTQRVTLVKRAYRRAPTTRSAAHACACPL
jgi:hypothetical protein